MTFRMCAWVLASFLMMGCSDDVENVGGGASTDAAMSGSGGGSGSGSGGGSGGGSGSGSGSGSSGGSGGSGGVPACDPACASGEVCVSGSCRSGITGVSGIDSVLLGDSSRFDSEVLISQNPDMTWRPSRIYRWADFVQAVATMHLSGVGDMRLWLGDADADETRRTQQAMVNLAAFLAQSMKETIRYDACDENNWDNSNNYQISNSCGQLGQNYADYDCDMACPQDPSMQMTAVTNAVWYGAPGPMFCAPNSVLQAAGLANSEGRTGYWNHSSDCWPYPASEASFSVSSSNAWERADCEVYSGQRGGAWVWDGSGGSVEGCCWWGRGVIQTTGRCNFGILNHYLGQSHLDPSTHTPPSDVLYPELNFCRDPEVICSSTAHPELKWVAGIFYWMSSVQTYDEGGWNYLTELRSFVDGGLSGNGFIDSVSGIVNRGCHNPPCATGAVDGLEDRRTNFDLVLRTMGLR